MKTGFLTAALTATLTITAPVRAELAGDQITAALSGQSIRGTGPSGPYRVTFHPDGTVQGVAGLNDEFQDSGTWWVKDNSLCRRYETWFEGKTGCYQIRIEGRVILWLIDGIVVSKDQILSLTTPLNKGT